MITIFEKIMDEQTDAFIDEKLSKYVCGYRKGDTTLSSPLPI